MDSHRHETENGSDTGADGRVRAHRQRPRQPAGCCARQPGRHSRRNDGGGVAEGGHGLRLREMRGGNQAVRAQALSGTDGLHQQTLQQELSRMDWTRLFPAHDFRFPMALRPGDTARFFAHEDSTGATLRERGKWFEDRERARLYASAEADSREIIEEIFEVVTGAHASSRSNSRETNREDSRAPTDAYHLCREIGSRTEPDWVVLREDSNSIYRLIGGAVCFPSAWAMTEKIGKSVEEIHAIVPGLNAALGRAIHSFLSKLVPGEAWERENWGLSADAELN